MIVKPSYARGSHLFEVPILLSDTYRDPVALAVASLVPPLVSLTLHYCVVKPLRRHWKVQEVRDMPMWFVVLIDVHCKYLGQLNALAWAIGTPHVVLHYHNSRSVWFEHAAHLCMSFDRGICAAWRLHSLLRCLDLASNDDCC